MKYLAILFLLFLVCQDGQENPSGPRIAIEPKQKITSNIFFVIDCSGSMQGDRYSKAVDTLISIATQETDELNISALAFDQKQTRWIYQYDGNTPNYWARLPDLDAIERLHAWLGTVCQNGNTTFIPAITTAFNEPKRDLTIIVISDGIFDEDQGEIVASVLALQENRRPRHGDAVFVGFGISPTLLFDDLRAIVRNLPDSCNGGYFIDGEQPY